MDPHRLAEQRSVAYRRAIAERHDRERDVLENARRSLDFDEIRRLADAASRDFLENRWEAYLAMAERVEALPQNQSGADKSWVERADRAHRDQVRAAQLVR